MPARPNRQRDARPGKRYGGDADTKAPRDYSLAQETDTSRILEEKNEADNFEEHDAVACRERFPLFGRLGIKRADRPVEDEGHPGDVN